MLTLAVPKGRILKELEPILRACDIIPEDDFYDENCRKLEFQTSHDNVNIIRVRSFDVATFVAFGAAQLGICGGDILREFQYKDVFAPVDLGIGRCRLSLAENKNIAEHDDPKSWSHIRIATKYPNLSSQYFAAKGVQVETIKLNGAMELAPKLGMCRRIVDLVSTGKTLQENGLVEIETLMEVSAQLVTNRTAMKTNSAVLRNIIGKFKSESIKNAQS